MEPRRPPPELVDDLVVEILLRFPPDEPACLVRASLVCKSWRHNILFDPAFRRRHHAFHGTPPMLGCFQIVNANHPYSSRYVSTSAFGPADRVFPSGWLAQDCRHGRVLFLDLTQSNAWFIVVWDVLTDELHHLPPAMPPPRSDVYNAAVFCAAAAEGCDHTGCHGGPFRVAFVFTKLCTPTGRITSACVYSSETDGWSEQTPPIEHHEAFAHVLRPSASSLVGDRVYFRGNRNYTLEYQLGAHRLSVIDGPPWSVLARTFDLLMSTEDGGLAFAFMEKSSTLCLWSRVAGSDGVAGWVKSREIELQTLLPAGAFVDSQLAHHRPDAYVLGFAEGTDAIFVGVRNHTYMIQLNSGRVRKLFDGVNCVFPYMSF